MIFSLSSYQNEAIVREAVRSSGIPEYETLVELKIDFKQFVKQKVSILGSIEVILIDRSAVMEDSFEEGLKCLLEVFEGIQVIIYAPEYDVEDPVIEKCMETDIYDMCFFQNAKELAKTIRVGYTKESFQFMLQHRKEEKNVVKVKALEEPEQKPKRKRKKVQKINFYSTMPRIGCTFNALCFGTALAVNGKKVLVHIPDSITRTAIENGYEGIHSDPEKFIYQGITFSKTDLPKNDYDYVIEDCGVTLDQIENTDLNILVTGARAWEFCNLAQAVQRGCKLETYTHLITFAPKDSRDSIRQVFADIPVFFPEYIEDPFNMNEEQKRFVLKIVEGEENEKHPEQENL